MLRSGSSTYNPSWCELQNVRFYRNRFCREVNNLPLHQGFRLDLTQFTAQISLDIYSGALHSPFSLFYTIKALNGKLTVLGDFFSLHIQSWIEPHKDFFIRADGSVYINVSYQ